jgi:hypothetical protein
MMENKPIELSWYVNDTSKIMECEASGVPKPDILWKLGSHVSLITTFQSNRCSSVIFKVHYI